MNDDAAILLIEDSDTQALQLRRMFERAGFRIDRTRDAETALETLNHSRPDLLVVDYRLPGMNGDELVRIVRQTGATRTLPILLLMFYSFNSSRLAGRRWRRTPAPRSSMACPRLRIAPVRSRCRST